MRNKHQTSPNTPNVFEHPEYVLRSNNWNKFFVSRTPGEGGGRVTIRRLCIPPKCSGVREPKNMFSVFEDGPTVGEATVLGFGPTRRSAKPLYP